MTEPASDKRLRESLNVARKFSTTPDNYTVFVPAARVASLLDRLAALRRFIAIHPCECFGGPLAHEPNCAIAILEADDRAAVEWEEDK